MLTSFTFICQRQEEGKREEAMVLEVQLVSSKRKLRVRDN